jgi:hypothetical protein
MNDPGSPRKSLVEAAVLGGLLGALAFAATYVVAVAIVWAVVAYYADRPGWHWPTVGSTSILCCVMFIVAGAVRGVMAARRGGPPPAA